METKVSNRIQELETKMRQMNKTIETPVVKKSALNQNIIFLQNI